MTKQELIILLATAVQERDEARALAIKYYFKSLKQGGALEAVRIALKVPFAADWELGLHAGQIVYELGLYH